MPVEWWKPRRCQGPKQFAPEVPFRLRPQVWCRCLFDALIIA